ncbi:chromosome segregation protein SMC [Anaerolentibacter hominis]|uniref:chromosome segregation protein SMC n=1 Tax=Anaerolentibacter hominis TaxID=3079009 RepID=UPI0031B88FED
MYLKSIEVQGFKSFVHKMKFEFYGGITGIVGPNGSGKSNIGDAVRWVLGEQSARQLRGSKMEDVIFSGTETRKPLGFAYVALTLDNSDHMIPIEYDEVTVARRVYRSGESEYLINGNGCRLRDVQELFFDTGIGKEGYSIIGQGQVDKILSSKPEDRRELFDEAAGISKFKKRKNQAEKNLDAEHQNLNRVNDILGELEKQIGPLERQSAAAKTYLSLRDELKVLDVNLFLMQYDSMENGRKELEEKIQIASKDLEAARESYEGIRKEYDELEASLEEENRKLEEKRSLLEQKKINLEQLGGRINVMQEQIAGMQQSDLHLQDRKESLQKEQEDRLRELEEGKKKLKALEEEIEASNVIIQQKKQALFDVRQKAEQYSRLMEEGYDKVLERMENDSDTKAFLERSHAVYEQTQSRKNALLEEMERSKTEGGHLKETVRKGQEELNVLNSRLSRYQVSNEMAQEDSQELKKTLEEKSRELQRSSQEMQRTALKLESLQNIAERYDGYGNSIRRVMEQKERQPGIIGVVADIIKVEKEYETAVEVALGGSIQNIVTETEETAKQLVAYLKKNKFGRATFLPLESMKHNRGFQQKEVLNEPGVIGLGSTLVKAEAKYDKLTEYLLGRIVVVDTIQNALSLAKKYRYSLRMVTKDGELLTPGGAITGGTYKNSGNLLGRNREMEELKHSLGRLKKENAGLKAEVEELQKELQEKQDILAENSEALKELAIKKSVLSLKCEQAAEAQKAAAGRLDALEQEYAGQEEELEKIRSQIKELEAELAERGKKSQSAEEAMEEYSRELEEFQAAAKQQDEELAKLRLDFAAAEQSRIFQLQTIGRLEEEISHFNQEEESLDRTIDQNKVQIAEKEQEIGTLREQMENERKLVDELEGETAELAVKKNDIALRQKSFFEKRETMSEQMNALDKEVFRLNGQKEKMEAALQSQMDYMWEQYELTYNRALLLKTDSSQSQNQMKKSIGELKEKIRALGDININAIEDYKNLSERYELLSSQRNDIVSAEESLRRIIEELDTEMRRQFREKFDAINQEFNKVFKELFGGGHGRLELVEDEDILEAGIRIIAQPPGKKLQNMMMLSGGEKALTAISLLFGILNLKPSPFCLLDEIEAALDDSNVGRFADYLKKLSKKTQFIVITHRRGTMTAADILYGITMQEKGVSTMVSVNLLDDQLDK